MAALERGERLETPRPVVSVRFDPMLLDDIDELAARRGWTRSKWIELACIRLVKAERGH